MEIEAKFSFRDAADFAAWQQRTAIGPFVLGPARSKDVVDEYLDTEERDCMAAGYACRVRHRDETAVATLKSLANAALAEHASVRRREEHEVALHPPHPPMHAPAAADVGAGDDAAPRWQQPAAWPESEARSLVQRLVDGRPLRHLVTLRQRRYERDVLDRDRVVAELSLDQVSFDDGRPPMYELEVELAPSGDEADLAAIVAALSGDPAFEPQARSKLQRALAGTRPPVAPQGAAAGLLHENGHGALELAVRLFEGTASCHRLPPERRGLVEALVRAVAAAPGPLPANAVAVARDAALAGAELGEDSGDHLLKAAVLDLLASLADKRQRGDGTPRLGQKLVRTDPAFLSLTGGEVAEARALAALIYVATTLGACGVHSSDIATITIGERCTTVALTGPRADAAARAAASAKGLWREVFGSRLKTICTAAGDRYRPLGLRFDQPLAEAGRLVLRRQFEQLRRCEAGARDGDAEALHDARVAARRMRTALRLLRGAYIGREVAPLLDGLKATGDALGAVRDLDVSLHTLRAERERVNDGAALDPLLAHLERTRAAARERLLEHLSGSGYRAWCEHLGAFLATGGTGRTGWDRVCDRLPQLVWRRYGAVRTYQPRVPAAGLDELHELRKQAKQLRYLLEFFCELLGKGTPALIEQVTGVQDALGRLHDAAVMRDLIAHQTGDGAAAARPGLAAHQARSLATIAEQRRIFLELWPRFTARRFRRRLAKAAAAM